MYLPTRRVVGTASLFTCLAVLLAFSTFSDSFPIIVTAQGKTPQQTPDTVPQKTDAPAAKAQATPPSDDKKPVPPEIDGPVIVHTDLITLTVTVTDTYGRYVSGLGKGAFTVLDDKKQQEITYFSDDDSPVSVGVIFDLSGSMSGEKGQASSRRSVKVYSDQS